MMKKAIAVVLSLLILLTAVGCAPKEKPVESEETQDIQDTQPIIIPQTSTPETTAALENAEDERDFPEQTQPNTEAETEYTEPGTMLEDPTDAEQTEPAVTQPQETESKAPGQEPSLDDNETEVDR